MRYAEIATISFTDFYGNKYAIKDMREYPAYNTMENLSTRADDRIDEIATRKEYYGDDAEGETYKICEHNIEALFEARFDMANIKSLRIPVR
jgi:hypothetical protein